ncbi:MAG: polysaccharide deacetylase family protein [Prevotella sp.]|nr:polysaccharide deacetylase family protein [Prevotella sp.]MBQ6031852.1 polysaccharide deacetylase family protein [Prevotella sp.]MBR0524586.1 polysaccharide deacetylase family protein [Prevotella sp.]
MIEQPARWMRKLYPHATWRMDPEEHAVYLTFDDGPIPEATPFILKTLADFDVKATFFMVGDNVRKFPHLYQQVKDAGHQIGNHTMNHLGSFRHWTTTYVINVFQANELIHSHLFRPPHGWMRHSVYYWIKKYYRVVFWDVVTRDYSNRLTAEDVVNNVKRLTRNGSIITFHDSLKSIDKLYTALPESIQWLKDQGYEFKVIP